VTVWKELTEEQLLKKGYGILRFVDVVYSVLRNLPQRHVMHTSVTRVPDGTFENRLFAGGVHLANDIHQSAVFQSGCYSLLVL